MTTTFEEVAEKVRRKVAAKFRTHSDVEDFQQEAVVNAWKSWMDGKPEAYVVFWSVKKVSGYLGGKPRAYTGSERPHGGNYKAARTTAGDAAREKIKQAQKEYRDLYGGMPNQVQISQMTGIPARAVSKYLNRDNFSMAAELPDAPKLSSLDGWAEDHANDDLGFSKALAEPGFEETSVDTLVVREALPELKDREREVVFLRYWQDLPQAEVARTMDISPAYVHRVHKSALNRLRNILDVA